MGVALWCDIPDIIEAHLVLGFDASPALIPYEKLAVPSLLLMGARLEGGWLPVCGMKPSSCYALCFKNFWLTL